MLNLEDTNHIAHISPDFTDTVVEACAVKHTQAFNPLKIYHRSSSKAPVN